MAVGQRGNLNQGKLQPKTLNHARDLRQNITNAEKKLWVHLRGKRLNGLKFRRQHPIEPYIVDFFCHSANLVIELDGDSHDGDKAAQYDSDRQSFLEDQGLRVLRFRNKDVYDDVEQVLEEIAGQAFKPSLSAKADISPKGRD
ncbi:MAG: DUF559 domain-containing protein [Deltaproteobacteria bacterium]|nr:DUF559 domain-containing protein [Deltaproteobacteria bacterium]